MDKKVDDSPPPNFLELDRYHNLMAEVDAGCHNDDVFAIIPSAQLASKKPQEKKKTVKAKQELCWFHDRFDAMSCRETGNKRKKQNDTIK